MVDGASFVDFTATLILGTSTISANSLGTKMIRPGAGQRPFRNYFQHSVRVGMQGEC
jgi:hypothetical protein